MGVLLELSKTENKTGSAVMYAAALIFIYTLPAISHLINYPVYYFEPMKIMLILSIAHTGKWSSIFIALTLPAFSFIISDHPSLLYSFIMTGELLVCVLLFFALIKRVNNIFAAMSVAVIISKLFYFSVKFVLLQVSVINGELFTTPVLVQVFNIIVLSGYLHYFSTNSFKENSRSGSVA